MKRICLVLGWSLSMFVLLGCSASPQDAAPIKAGSVEPSPIRTPEKQQAAVPNDVCSNIEIKQDITLSRDIGWMKETWKQFTADGRYCIPNSQQFNIPEAAAYDGAMKRTIEAMIGHSYTYGSFTKDLFNQDFIAIVIDKTLPPPNNFSIVMFPEPKDGKTIPEPYWLFKNQDLSRSTVSGASSMTVIGTYTEDGTSKGCFVNWNEKQKQPSCDTKHKPPRAEWKSN